MSVSPELHNMYLLPESWQKFSEHKETLALDLTTESGKEVTLYGEAHVWPNCCRVFVSAGTGCAAAGLNLWEVSGALSRAVLDGLIGSDTLRGAIERGWTVGSAAANGGAA